MKKIKFLAVLFFFFYLFSFAYAEIINYGKPVDKRWKEDRAKEAYRPYPVVFSHGFGAGGPRETWVERDKQKESEKPKLDEKLEPYFRNYYYGNVVSLTQEPIKALQYSRFPYLELVSYIDFSKKERSQLIDRNSSIDTYKMEDYYVFNYERHPGDPGWADKLNAAVEKVRENYTDRNGSPLKINLVCHSMGGLTAREYLTKPKYGDAPDKVSKVIMTGVPNLGSSLATLSRGLVTAQAVGWFVPYYGWLSSLVIGGIDAGVEMRGKIDADGDAARDMDPSILGSGFLKDLNHRPQPPNVDYFVICGIRQFFRSEEGDGVVTKKSQFGTEVLKLKGAVEINASHGTESLEISRLEALGIDRAGNAKPLLKFIDSTKPELKITSPAPDKTTEIHENTINIKGTVSKEYLPADSILKIEVIRQEDGKSEAPIEGKLLYPSDLWVPSDSDSVVAEFDEPITFSQSGTYKISCQVKNPAGLSSDIKQVQVKVVSENPVITNAAPVGPIDDTKPIIYAKISSPMGNKINLSSITMSLDKTSILPVAIANKDGSDVEVYYSLTSELSRAAHQVCLSGSDEAGKSASKTWDFVIAPLSEITYVGSGQLVSASHKYGNTTMRSFSGEEFSQKLFEGRDIAATDCEYSDANKNNFGICIIWQGTTRNNGLVECCLATAQRLNFKMDVCKDYVPLYVVVRITPYHSGGFYYFIKLIHLEINGQEFELSEAYQQAIYNSSMGFYGGESVDFIVPYAEDVSVTYSFDPYIYTLDDYRSTVPDLFSVWAGTRLDTGVYAMGLCSAKQ
ncbi:MAG: hypothetical protein V2A64_08150 [Candidatus Omnitrophota bacterium]